MHSTSLERPESSEEIIHTLAKGFPTETNQAPPPIFSLHSPSIHDHLLFTDEVCTFSQTFNDELFFLRTLVNVSHVIYNAYQ